MGDNQGDTFTTASDVLPPLSEFNALVAERVEDARQRAGYSQQELADRAALSVGEVVDLEAGRLDATGYTLAAVAVATGTAPGDFIDGFGLDDFDAAEGPDAWDFLADDELADVAESAGLLRE